MVIEGAGLVFLAGCGGGVLNELLHWWNLRKKPEFPRYVRSAKYWILTLLMALVGGFIVWLYFGQQVEGVLAVHVGLLAPLILQKMASSVPEAAGARGREASVRSFFNW